MLEYSMPLKLKLAANKLKSHREAPLSVLFIGALGRTLGEAESGSEIVDTSLSLASQLIHIRRNIFLRQTVSFNNEVLTLL